MKIQSLFVVSIICFFCSGVMAEDTATVTGICKDGSPYTGKSKRGACRGHDGVKEWYGEKGAATSAPAPAAPAASAPAAEAARPSVTPAANEAATGLCKDGTPYTGKSKRGACRGHDGIKEWYADKPAASAAAVTTPPPATPAASETRVTETKPSAAATGICKDGTEYTGASKRGACRGHKGVKEWFADNKTPVTEPAPTPTATQREPAAAPVAAPAATTPPPSSETPAIQSRQAPEERSQTPSAASQREPAPAPAARPAAQAKPAASEAVQAPPAGSGQVWVNSRSKIYHCEGSKFYGKTKEGEFMSEADAQAKGFVANRKKICNK